MTYLQSFELGPRWSLDPDLTLSPEPGLRQGPPLEYPLMFGIFPKETFIKERSLVLVSYLFCVGHMLSILHELSHLIPSIIFKFATIIVFILKMKKPGLREIK
jgi:hypothetical protein